LNEDICEISSANMNKSLMSLYTIWVQRKKKKKKKISLMELL
jgi:hypothetical protein